MDEQTYLLSGGSFLAGLAALFLPKLLEAVGLKKPSVPAPTPGTPTLPTTGNAAIDKLLPLLPPKIAAVVVLLLKQEEKVAQDKLIQDAKPELERVLESLDS